MDFDSIDGLTLRTLNEAKSAYVCFKFQPSFFERCTAPPLEMLERRGRKRYRSSSSSQQSQSSNTNHHDDVDDGHGTNDDLDDDGHFTCRLAIKTLTAAIRQRKSVQSLRLYIEEVSSSLHLSFEYFLAVGGNVDEAWTTSLRVVHRVPIADYPVAIVSAVASHAGASEILVQPKMLIQLLDPLSRHSETAMIIPSPTSTTATTRTNTSSNKNPQILATCFQQHADHGTSSSNTLLGSHLQTETRLSFEDLEEIEYVDDRVVDEDDDDEDKPADVNESVALVFSRKEAKAILQWAAAATATMVDRQAVRLYFHWGGRPLILEQQTDQWKVELVLATLDHKLLGKPNGGGRN